MSTLSTSSDYGQHIELPAKENVTCPVCDAEKYTLKYGPWVDIQNPAKLYGAASGIPGTQTIVVCQECGMIYESPRFPDEVILQGYISANDAGHDSQYAMRVNSFYRSLKSLQESLPDAGAKILDVGTAGGGFLEAAQKFGYEAVGLEPSHYLVKIGQQRGFKIEQGTLENHIFSPSSFDMVCLWDVLEHVTDPRMVLLRIRELLKPGGVLLINYPDIGTWQAKLAGRRFWWLLSVHLHYFSRDSIRDICERTGFQVFHFKPYWQTLEFGYLEDMAIHYNIPLSKFFKQFTPKPIQKLPVPYYASQTTALARVKS